MASTLKGIPVCRFQSRLSFRVISVSLSLFLSARGIESSRKDRPLCSMDQGDEPRIVSPPRFDFDSNEAVAPQ